MTWTKNILLALLCFCYCCYSAKYFGTVRGTARDNHVVLAQGHDERCFWIIRMDLTDNRLPGTQPLSRFHQ